MMPMTCPAEHELLPLASDEPGESGVSEHVASCSSCQRTLERLTAEVRTLRQDYVEESTEPWPEPSVSWVSPGDPAPDAPGTTEDWTPPDPSVSTAPDPSAAARDRSMAPPAIGKYLVVGELDRGGQAVVLRVVHAGLGRELALKYALKPLAVGDSARGLIAEEARVLAGLPDHPGLVRVHDMDLHDGHLYMVMDFVRGRSLAQFAKDHRPGPRQSAALVAEAARAAGVAHRCGVVHQDIKPKNILVDHEGRARLIDFGMARLRHAWSEADGDDGPSGGTLEFMAPEQARDETDKVGPRSDVFGLGAVLYFLLTGRPPFVGETRDEIWDRAKRCDFDAAALRTARVPRRLERTCLRALAADPADRYATAEEMGRALKSFIRGPQRLALQAAILLLLAVPALVWTWWPGPAFTSSVQLQVFRGETVILRLASALPLRTGDRVVIRCPVERGSRADVFWLDSDGRLTELSPIGIEPGRDSDDVVYPASGRAPVIGPPGTELVVVCARRSGELPREEAAALFATVPRLPRLPREVGVRLRRSSIEFLGDRRSLGEPELDSVEAVRDALDQLRRRLTEKYDFIEGIAFPHVAAPSNPAPGPG